MSKVPKAQPWAKKRTLSPSWQPTPHDIFRNLDVVRAAVWRAGVRTGDVEDVVADVIDLAWRRLRRFKGHHRDPVGSFRGWLNTIAWRTARDRRLQEKRLVALSFQEHSEEQLLYPSPHARAEARFDLRRVGCLSPRYRAVAVVLAMGGDLKDASEALNIPLGTAATRVRALRRQLRRWGIG